MENITYTELTAKYFTQVITLANKVHGVGYLDATSLTEWVSRGIDQNINTSVVALLNEQVIGFRITYAAKQWDIDKWCTPKKWQVAEHQCCYFKCNTVDENYRGFGVGKKLLQLAITAAKKQGAQAGIAHLWKQSPNNSAVAYFTRCGGQLVKSHPDKWNEFSKSGYHCIICGDDCHCEAAEMIIRF